MHDASRLRDLARLRTRQPLSEAEAAEVPELRKRLRRADADAVMVLVIEHGGAAAGTGSDHPWVPPGRLRKKLPPSMPPCPSSAAPSARRGRRPGTLFPTWATPASTSAGLGTPRSSPCRNRLLLPRFRATDTCSSAMRSSSTPFRMTVRPRAGGVKLSSSGLTPRGEWEREPDRQPPSTPVRILPPCLRRFHHCPPPRGDVQHVRFPRRNRLPPTIWPKHSGKTKSFCLVCYEKRNPLSREKPAGDPRRSHEGSRAVEHR